MHVRTSVPRKCAAVVLVGAMFFAAGCNKSDDSDKSGSSDKKVELTWWHNADKDPGKKTMQEIADAYTKDHPNVTFKIEAIQTETIKTKIPLALQSNDPPDIYQQWGAGMERDHLKSGKLMDMTADVKGWVDELGKTAKIYQVDDKWYGIPYTMHVVGFWYRMDLFQQAGIAEAPKTMDDFYAAVDKLKAKNIQPIALGGKDKWPDAFYYANFATRECAPETLKKAIKDQKFSDPCFVKAGQDLKQLIDKKPFNEGFLGTSAQQGAGSAAGLLANGKAAIELQGDWELGTMIPLTEDKDFASKLGWFPFPTITGGKGDPKAIVGGGDGFSCTSKATKACPDFLKYLTSVDVQKKMVTTDTIGMPANPKAADALKYDSLKKCAEALQNTTYMQHYFDQAMASAVGSAVNDAVANYFSGQGSPEEIAKSVEKAASN